MYEQRNVQENRVSECIFFLFFSAYLGYYALETVVPVVYPAGIAFDRLVKWIKPVAVRIFQLHHHLPDADDGGFVDLGEVLQFRGVTPMLWYDADEGLREVVEG